MGSFKIAFPGGKKKKKKALSPGKKKKRKRMFVGEEMSPGQGSTNRPCLYDTE